VSGATLQNMSVSNIVSTLESQMTIGPMARRRIWLRSTNCSRPTARTRPHTQEEQPDPGDQPEQSWSALYRRDEDPGIPAEPVGWHVASRVQVYISPGIVTSIALGLGPNHNLNKYDRPIRRTWRAVMPGLALAGGLHLEMYHGSGTPLTAFTAQLLRSSPGAFLGLLREYHGNVSTVHLVFTDTTIPAGAHCGGANAMACSWKLARSTSAGRAILANARTRTAWQRCIRMAA